MLKNMAAVLAVFLLSLTAVGVSAQTHHVVGGWGSHLDVHSWLSGRVFTVGDKIWFKNSGREDSIVEVGGVEEFESCNVANPIRMFTDPLNHVLLEKEGIRYFTSSNPEMCKNGLKLPIPVHPPPEFDPSDDPSYPGHISPPFDPSDYPSDPDHKYPPFDPSDDPSDPDHKYPPFDPSYDPPTPPFDPYPPVKPTPPTPPHEPPPVRPPPPHEPKPVQPPPSAAPAHFTAVSFMVSAGLLLCYYGSI